MSTVSISEARAALPELLDRVLADATMVRVKAVRKDIQRRHEALQEKVEKLLA